MAQIGHFMIADKEVGKEGLVLEKYSHGAHITHTLEPATDLRGEEKEI